MGVHASNFSTFVRDAFFYKRRRCAMYKEKYVQVPKCRNESSAEMVIRCCSNSHLRIYIVQFSLSAAVEHNDNLQMINSARVIWYVHWIVPYAKIKLHRKYTQKTTSHKLQSTLAKNVPFLQWQLFFVNGGLLIHVKMQIFFRGQTCHKTIWEKSYLIECQ